MTCVSKPTLRYYTRWRLYSSLLVVPCVCEMVFALKSVECCSCSRPWIWGQAKREPEVLPGLGFYSGVHWTGVGGVFGA